jgi:hypothetical protein
MYLPYCRESLVAKTKFWSVGGLLAAFGWEYKKVIGKFSYLASSTIRG